MVRSLDHPVEDLEIVKEGATMKHSDYLNLTGRLRNLAREADHTRAILTDDDMGAYWGEIWRAVEDIDTTYSELMDFWADGWTDTNQGRADMGLRPTADVRKLFVAMNDFVRVTDTPVGRWDVLYSRMRHRCRQWIDQAVEWFPDLNTTDTPSTDTTDISTAKRLPGKPYQITVTIDRVGLMGCFNESFLEPNEKTGVPRFDGFIESFVERATQYTVRDIGRVAYQIHNSQWANLGVRNSHWPAWYKRFCEMCGVPFPTDHSSSRVNKTTKATDYSFWLK